MIPIKFAIFINRHAHNLTAIMFLPILFGIIIAIEYFRL